MQEVQIFGDFEEIAEEHGESLSMVFTPSDSLLKKRWENNGLSADFIADYFRNFYIIHQEAKDLCLDDYVIDNMRDAVKYIANELLENAMKFQDSNVPFTAQITLLLHTDRLVFRVTNGVKLAQAESFLHYVQNLLASDPQDLYLQAMRDSAKAENKTHSGLGLLSMICDYSATLGWKFEPNPNDNGTIIVSTMVTLHT